LPASDLDLLISAARSAGDIATPYWRNSPKTWEKDAGAGPVTEADLAVDAMLCDTLMAARPGYGWLSEETEDSAARLECEHVFIIDPIDGTRSFIAGEKTWAHSLAIARKGEITAGVIFLPLLDKLYQARAGDGAYLNGAQIQVSDRTYITGATVLAARPSFDASHWIDAAPDVKRQFRPSLAYRMALVAEGRFDAMLSLRNTWEWDVAAGVLIAAQAGGSETDRNGHAPVFNNPTPTLAGLIAANHNLHQRLHTMLA